MDLRSGAAFWPIRDGLLHTYPPLEEDLDADVVVIGAGCTGALVAHRLTAAGAAVVVLDKRDVASGSSAATTGLLVHETDTSLLELADSIGECNAVRVWKLGLEAVSEIEQLCADIEGGCGFDRRGTLYLASTRRDARRLAVEHAFRARHGFDVEWLSGREIAQRYGIDAPGGIYSRGNGQIDNFCFTHSVLHAAAVRGARIFDRTEVQAAEARKDHIIVATAGGPRVRARRVVWATGYESNEETQKRVGRMHSTWALVSEPVHDLGSWRNGELIWETARPYLYARVTCDNRVMLGGEDEPFSRRHANEGLLVKKSARLVKRFNAWFPAIDVDVAYRWAGVFTTTRDGLPYIGSVPQHPHAWLVLGYGGNGITFAMVAARMIGDAWLGRSNSDARLFAFDRQRRLDRI